MKQITREAVATQLTNNQALEHDGESFRYYIHFDELTGEMIPSVQSAKFAKTFSWNAPFVDEIMERHENADEAWDEIAAVEQSDSRDFWDIVDGLTEEINEWMREEDF